MAVLFVGACQSIKSDDILSVESSLPDKIDFNFHIKPLLSDRCFKCHGPDASQRKGDLRLDLASDALKKATNESSRAQDVLLAGSLRKSELVLRILSQDPNYMMPPPESNLHLTAYERAMILKWVEQGAEYKMHWSFNPPSPVAIPDIGDEGWGGK